MSYATIKDVAESTQLSWHTVKEIERTYLSIHYSKPRLKGVKYLAIDEFAIQKGHKYMTVVIDYETGRVLYANRGKKSSSLNAFWRRINSLKSNIKAVAIDMSAAYIKAVTENLPKAKIVFDRFHIVKLINEKLSDLRRAMYKQEEYTATRQVLKGTRWLLLKKSEKLDKSKSEKKKLEEALQLNKPLATMYYMKEELNLMWTLHKKSEAQAFLDSWCARALASGIKHLKQIANTLLGFRTGILNWFDANISTGPLEGLNNKIKVLKRKAYGYRDHEFFILKIQSLHHHRIRHALFR